MPNHNTSPQTPGVLLRSTTLLARLRRRDAEGYRFAAQERCVCVTPW